MRRSAWRSVNELCDAEGTINRDLEFFFEVFKKVYHGKGGRTLPPHPISLGTDASENIAQIDYAIEKNKRLEP